MNLLNIKNERKLLDSGVVIVAAVSAYLIGYFQVLALGAITVTLTLPNAFLVGIAYLHLVIRKGRKFDREEHRLSYEGFKTMIFGGLIYTSFASGLSTTQNSLVPGEVSMLLAASFFFLTSIYLMAYRANS